MISSSRSVVIGPLPVGSDPVKFGSDLRFRGCVCDVYYRKSSNYSYSLDSESKGAGNETNIFVYADGSDIDFTVNVGSGQSGYIVCIKYADSGVTLDGVAFGSALICGERSFNPVVHIPSNCAVVINIRCLYHGGTLFAPFI